MLTSWTLHYSTNNSTYTLYLRFPWDLDSAEPQRRERCESCSLPDKTACLTHSSLWAREHHWTETFPGHSHAHTSWEKMRINASQVSRVCLSKSGPLIRKNICWLYSNILSLIWNYAVTIHLQQKKGWLQVDREAFVSVIWSQVRYYLREEAMSSLRQLSSATSCVVIKYLLPSNKF